MAFDPHPMGVGLPVLPPPARAVAGQRDQIGGQRQLLDDIAIAAVLAQGKPDRPRSRPAGTAAPPTAPWIRSEPEQRHRDQPGSQADKPDKAGLVQRPVRPEMQALAVVFGGEPFIGHGLPAGAGR